MMRLVSPILQAPSTHCERNESPLHHARTDGLYIELHNCESTDVLSSSWMQCHKQLALQLVFVSPNLLSQCYTEQTIRMLLGTPPCPMLASHRSHVSIAA